MKYTVKTPSESFNGKRAGIQFNRGLASFEDAKLIQIFTELGYEVSEVKEAIATEKKPAKPKAKKRGE